MVKFSGLVLRRFRQVQKFQQCIKRQLSSATAESLAQNHANLSVKCSEQNPENQSSRHSGEYYTIPKETVSTLFSHGLPKPAYLDEVKTLDEFNIMIRKPAISILESIKSDESAVRKFVIYGQDGCGKTMTLSHILHYCYLQEWLILFLPS
ncbi:28S ribosomal S29, mitochondrial, partial, partial [Paramuricea clavata]